MGAKDIGFWVVIVRENPFKLPKKWFLKGKNNG
jgi:hypothetical protein